MKALQRWLQSLGLGILAAQAVLCLIWDPATMTMCLLLACPVLLHPPADTPE